MQVNDFMVKKKELDAHVQFLKEQLLLVESRKERERLYSVLDELLAEKMQIDDYLEEASLEKNKKLGSSYIDKIRESKPDSDTLFDDKEKDCPEIQNAQIAKLCEIEKGKLVKLCVSSYCISLGYRWCIYYGKNKGGRYVFSEADRTIKKIDSSWGESLCLYMDKTEFWKDRTVIIKDEMEEEKTTRFYKAPPPPI
nr:hypothetical protein Clen_348 [Cedratvirus lena]